MKAEDPRENSRANVFLMAVLQHKGASIPVRIRNISATGALLDAQQALPEEGAHVNLCRGEYGCAAEVVWTATNCCGVRFNSKIETEHWVRRVGHAGQQRVDRVVAELRAGNEPKVREYHSVQKGTLADLAAELTQISEDISNVSPLTDELCQFVIRIDVVATRLRNFATSGESQS